MLPNEVEFEKELYDSTGMVKLNNGAFLIAKKGNKLSSLDFTSIPELAEIKLIPFSKPTKAEEVFMEYYLGVMQQNVDNGQLTTIPEINKACVNINKYINEGDEEFNKYLTKEKKTELLNDIKELEGKDHIVIKRKKALLDHFAEKMSGNQYFQQTAIEQQTEAVVETIVPESLAQEYIMPTVESTIPQEFVAPMAEEIFNLETPVLEQPIETITENVIFPESMNYSNELENTFPEVTMSDIQPMSMGQPYYQPESLAQEYTMSTVESTIPQEVVVPMPGEILREAPIAEQSIARTPEYDEQTVTDILQIQAATPRTNFDVEQFVKQYFNSLTSKQIDLLLNNFRLNENLIVMLKQRKGTMQVLNSLENAEIRKNTTNEPINVSNVVEKRKRFSLLGEKDSNKKAAFVDTLLLSFTVGTLCGVYLMYFILTIMS